MTKKNYDGKVRSTVDIQDKALAARFDKADSVLLIPAVGAATPEEEVVKPVRDTFSMPAEDYALIEVIRTSAAMMGRIFNKSEIVRAGLQVLNKLDGPELVAALDQLVKVKPGRKK